MMPMMTRGSKPSGKLWYPAADVYETEMGWLVKVELAGVSLDEIEIDVQGDTLLLAGTRRDSHCGECLTFHQLEITYSRFEKILRFPKSIQNATVEHNFDNGLLIINLKKAE